MATEKAGRFRHLVPILKNYKSYFWIGTVATVFANGLILITPYLIKLAFDAVQDGAASTYILRLCIYMVLLALVAGVFRFAMRRSIIWTSRKVEYDVRNLLFTKFLALDQSYYHHTKTGDLMAHATNDIEAVRMMIGPAVMHIVNSIVSVAIALAFMLSLSAKLSLYTILPMTLLSLAVYRLGSVVHRKFLAIQAHFSYLTTFVQENLAGIRVIKAYRREESEIDRFGGASRKYADMNLDMMKFMGLFQPMLFFIAGGVSLLILFIGGHEVTGGRISLGTLVAFFGYLAWLVWPMMSLGWVVSLYQRGTASLDRINKILNTTPGVLETASSAVDIGKEHIRGKIEFRDLTFAYPSPKGDFHPNPILQNINLTVVPGTRLGIIGPTGSGKTTLVSLLPRLYPTDGPGCSGQLLIDDIDINLWPLDILRHAVGFVPQETFLFSDTLEANINFSSLPTDHDEMTRAARLAALHRDAESFPAGYETVLGERGITLSGGQKQRTTLARAIMKEPAILILDDATSSVDTETEDTIFSNLQQVLVNRTSIIISHRVASIKDCDQIIYLDEGRILEEGDHASLMAASGAYAALYRRQLAEEELERM